ncbi:MAG: class I SAM-dependent methyltransferase [Deltaproteobacteria bacterium]|nr:class I SAM-dependent methyltransferase [Deltaproteobacteria bacterium]
MISTRLKSLLRRRLPPAAVKALFSAAMAGRRASGAIGLPLASTDWVGYEGLVDFIRTNRILDVPGDLLEIGAFLGGGTRKLCRMLEKTNSQKTLWVIDAFDPSLDTTTNIHGLAMEQLYASALAAFPGKTQRQVFDRQTAGCQNLRVIAQDSRIATLPAKTLCFAFLDGHHDPKSVQSDFALAWSRLSPGGALAFHDYGGDLYHLTQTIDALLSTHAKDIKTLQWDRDRWVLYAVKGQERPGGPFGRVPG